MIREGANAKQLQALIGHATVVMTLDTSVVMTLDTYSHLFDDDLPPALAEVRSQEMGVTRRPSGGQQKVNTTHRERPRSAETAPSRKARRSG